MSYPALRQPKCVVLVPEKRQLDSILADSIVLTLRDDKKLILSKDSYHGILTAGNMYKCIFCLVEMELNYSVKENHINSREHLEVLKNYPHLDEFGFHLLRKITEIKYYCTICNVLVSNSFLKRHIVSDAHTDELERAKCRALHYKTD